MKRRSFVQLLLALAGVPFLPKAKAASVLPNSRNDVITGIPCAGLQGPVGPAGPHLGPPVGTVLLKSGPLPNGCLPCDGRVISRLEHQPLFSALGTAYGEGDGRTTFALPDLNTFHVHGIRDPGHRHGTDLFCEYVIKAE
jgi:hypothetical protein